MTPHTGGVLESERVLLRTPLPGDQRSYLGAVARSQGLHHPWVEAPADASGFRRWQARAEDPRHAPLLLLDRQSLRPAGVFNLSEIVRGSFQSAFLGYFAFDPFAGTGRMAEGLQLTLGHAFGALDLHRVEANIQPENAESIALVEGAGFVLEGKSASYLRIGGRWRDHLRYALLAEGRPTEL